MHHSMPPERRRGWWRRRLRSEDADAVAVGHHDLAAGRGHLLRRDDVHGGRIEEWVAQIGDVHTRQRSGAADQDRVAEGGQRTGRRHGDRTDLDRVGGVGKGEDEQVVATDDESVGMVARRRCEGHIERGGLDVLDVDSYVRRGIAEDSENRAEADVSPVAAIGDDVDGMNLERVDDAWLRKVEEVDEVKAGEGVALEDSGGDEVGVARTVAERVEGLHDPGVVRIGEIDELDVAGAVEHRLRAHALDVRLKAVDPH